jgi:hypothetical protein
VLYLLHGSSGGAADWTSHGGAEQTTAGLGLIVVMPDIALRYDGGGWCTNWWNGGARYRIVVRSGSVVKSFVERTGRGGRLRIDVPLGPSDTVQEYPADGPPLGTTVYRTRVTIGRAGR